MNIDQFTHFLCDFHIKIDQKIPAVLKERVQVVGIKLEERTFAVGRLQGIPVEVSPGTVVAYAYVQHLTMGTFITLNGHGEGLQAVCGSYDTTVTVGLLDEMVVAFNQTTP